MNLSRRGITKYFTRNYVQALHRLSQYIRDLSLGPPFGHSLRTPTPFQSAYKALLMEDEKIFSGLVSEMTRWLPDIRHELVNVILLKESIVLCIHVHSMRRLGLSGAWLNMVCFHSSELWNTLELIGFSSVRFKRCGSLGGSNHVGRLDRRGVTRLFFRIQRLYSATSKPRRGEGMRDTAVLLRWLWLWFMWPRYEIRDINVSQLPWLLFWMNLDCGHSAVVWSLSSLPK